MPRLQDGHSYHFDDCLEDGYCVSCGDNLEFECEPTEDLGSLVQASCCGTRYVLKPAMVMVECWEVGE
jgi:hypothetical protein